VNKDSYKILVKIGAAVPDNMLAERHINTNTQTNTLITILRCVRFLYQRLSSIAKMHIYNDINSELSMYRQMYYFDIMSKSMLVL